MAQLIALSPSVLGSVSSILALCTNLGGWCDGGKSFFPTREIKLKKMFVPMKVFTVAFPSMEGNLSFLLGQCSAEASHKGRQQLYGHFWRGPSYSETSTSRDREGLRRIAKMAETAEEGLPIAEKPGKPGLEALSFFTDAAGASFTVVKGEKKFHENQDKGIACIGGTSTKDIWG